MAIIQLKVPPETSRLFSEIDVPGEMTDRGQHHVTILYLGDDVAIDVLAGAIEATYSVTSRTRPFTVRTTRVTCFPENPDRKEGYPVIARIESDELHEFRAALVAAFEKADIEYNDKFPIFKPHVTLSTSPDAVEEFRIPTIEWGAHEIVLWGGDEGDRKLSVTFPLTLHPSKRVVTAMAERVVDRFRSVALAVRYSARVPPARWG
jgi:2'-5' RNA ligase